jgi:hypothetical protein
VFYSSTTKNQFIEENGVSDNFFDAFLKKKMPQFHLPRHK